MNEVKVLSNDLGTGSREIQGIGLFCSSKVVKFKDQVLGEIRLVAPDDPPNSGVHETKLVS